MRECLAKSTAASPASATAAAEQQVIDAYGLHAIDLDLEEPEYENSGAIANELGAAQILQRDNSGLYISVTIPGTSAGTGWFGTQLLDEAKSLGFTPDHYSIMPFDGGFSGASSQISALQAFNGILTGTFGWSAATAYAHEGISSMNGRTDSAEYFYQSDFQTVLNWAESNGLGRYSFWSVNRDRQCNPPDNNGTLSGTCSSVPQNSWDFTKYDAEFAGATPPQSPPPTSASRPPAPRRPAGAEVAAAVARRPGARRPRIRAEIRSRTTGTTGPPTSGITTRCPAGRPGRGTTTAPVELTHPTLDH